MALAAPELDTRTFEEILDLARLRIPRYTPEWTDWNESDPGITLLELFAWLTELQLYELNRVPDRSYVKFLELLGLQLEPPQPATADVTFTAAPNGRVDPIPERTQVTASPPDGGPPIVFETEAGLGLVRVPLTDVQVFDGSAFTVVTAANATGGATFPPFGWVPQIGSALYLGFSQTNPPAAGRVFPQEIRLRVFLPPAANAGAPESCADAVHPPPAPVKLVFEYKPTKNAPAWRRLSVYEDETVALTREGYVLFEGPAQIEPTVEGRVTDERFWLRCRVGGGAYPAGREPVVDFLRPDTVRAQSLSTVRDEFVGTSEGHPSQSFTLRRRPVRRGSLQLEVTVQGESETWNAVEDFLASKPDDPHYVLDATPGTITFGDGRRGRIPVAGAELVAREYRFGGGAAANVAAGAITGLPPGLQGVASATNERPAVGGADEQSIDDLKEIAPAVLRHFNRAVTEGDFAALAARAGGVFKATAVPLAHPDHPGVEVAGAVTVVIVPEGDDVPPVPSADLVRSVCTYLEPYRLLTTEVFVKGPAYQAVTVHARVAAEPFAAFDAVEQAVVAALDRELDPVGRDFGEDLYPTSLYSVVLGVENVAAVPSLSIVVDGRPHSLTDPVVVPPDGLLYGTGHEIVVEPRKDL
jgi:predicted phage baseplate assembly protein